jgi:hypothetical protein
MNRYIRKRLRKDNQWKHQLGLLVKVDQAKGVKRVWYQIRLSIWEWLYKRPFRCKFGLHKFSWESFWMNSNYIGQVHFDCAHCGKKLFYIPIDDLPSDEQKKKLQFIRDASKVESE